MYTEKSPRRKTVLGFDARKKKQTMNAPLSDDNWDEVVQVTSSRFKDYVHSGIAPHHGQAHGTESRQQWTANRAAEGR